MYHQQSTLTPRLKLRRRLFFDSPPIISYFCLHARQIGIHMLHFIWMVGAVDAVGGGEPFRQNAGHDYFLLHSDTTFVDA